MLEQVPINLFLFSNELDNKENPMKEKNKTEIILHAINVTNKFHFANRFLSRKGPKIFVKEILLNNQKISTNCKISIFSGNVWLRKWIVHELKKGLTQYPSLILFHYWLLSRDTVWCKKMMSYFLGILNFKFYF